MEFEKEIRFYFLLKKGWQNALIIFGGIKQPKKIRKIVIDGGFSKIVD